MKRITAILMGIGISLAFAGCTSQSLEGQQEQVNFFGMDTYMTITAYGEDAGEAVEEAQARILKLEKEWSVTDESSQIYQANHSGGSPVTLSDDTRDVVSFALEMAEKTGGALEPTIYPVLEAWGFTTDENRIPAPDEIQTLLEHVGYEQVSLSGNELTLPEGVELDLGAVGKGYAGDAAAEVIKEQGVTSALLDLGGNIQAVGKRPDGTDWRIGIRNPFGDGQIHRRQRRQERHGKTVSRKRGEKNGACAYAQTSESRTAYRHSRLFSGVSSGEILPRACHIDNRKSVRRLLKYRVRRKARRSAGFNIYFFFFASFSAAMLFSRYSPSAVIFSSR